MGGGAPRLRGLRPMAGVETDTDGGLWLLAYDREQTLAEGRAVTARTVRPAAPAAASGCI